MRIDAITLAVLEVPRKEPFVIASGSATSATNVIVRLESGNAVGFGSACPNTVTKETRESVVTTIRTVGRALRGSEFASAHALADRMDTVISGNPAAKAGIDIAFHDLLAKERGVPLYRFLGGGFRDSIITDMTIGILDTSTAVERALHWVGAGFHALKIKVGLDPVEDLERVRAIRAAVGPGLELRVDGNQGFSVEGALRFGKGLEDLGVVVFEQPLPATDLSGMKVLSENCPVPVMADEMVLTAKDAMVVRWGGCAKAVNLKLMKHGGIQRAIEVNTVCESAGFPTMVGCMGESVVSIAAGLHLALALRNVRWTDLDSHFQLTRDIAEPLPFVDGRLRSPARPGLGVIVGEALFA